MLFIDVVKGSLPIFLFSRSYKSPRWLSIQVDQFVGLNRSRKFNELELLCHWSSAYGYGQLDSNMICVGGVELIFWQNLHRPNTLSTFGRWSVFGMVQNLSHKETNFCDSKHCSPFVKTNGYLLAKSRLGLSKCCCFGRLGFLIWGI